MFFINCGCKVGQYQKSEDIDGNVLYIAFNMHGLPSVTVLYYSSMSMSCVVTYYCCLILFQGEIDREVKAAAGV